MSTNAKLAWTTGCFAAAALWPTAFGALVNVFLTPAERLTRSAWCGAHSASEFLGHCAACWTGSAAFVLAGALILASERQRAIHAARR